MTEQRRQTGTRNGSSTDHDEYAMQLHTRFYPSPVTADSLNGSSEANFGRSKTLEEEIASRSKGKNVFAKLYSVLERSRNGVKSGRKMFDQSRSTNQLREMVGGDGDAALGRRAEQFGGGYDSMLLPKEHNLPPENPGFQRSV